MKKTTFFLAMALAFSTPFASFAKGPATIPPDIYKLMKKGKKLNLLWTSPDFDGTKGVRVGQLQNESGEEDNGEVILDYLPRALRRIIKADSPFTLHLAAVIADTTTKPKEAYAKARVNLEGRIVDADGTLVAAFDSQGVSSLGGNKNDSLRYATDIIVFAMTKDLFSFASQIEKEPATIVSAAPAAEKEPATIIRAVPSVEKQPATIVSAAPLSPAAASPAPAVAGPLAAPSIAPEEGLAPKPPAEAPAAPRPSTQPVAAQGTAPEPQAKPVPPAASPAPAQAGGSPEAASAPFLVPLPASILQGMKSGGSLGKLWVSPAYERSGGFAIGEVRYLVEERNSGVGGYLPDALREIGNPEASCQLQMGIVELAIRVQPSKGLSSVRLGVEGRLVAADGTVLAAFQTRENVNGVGDSVEDCRTASRRVVQAIRKELLP